MGRGEHHRTSVERSVAASLLQVVVLGVGCAEWIGGYRALLAPVRAWSGEGAGAQMVQVEQSRCIRRLGEQVTGEGQWTCTCKWGGGSLTLPPE